MRQASSKTTESDMLTVSHNSFQTFVKALKSSSDPPGDSGPSKIELAWQAWESETFYLPNKEEVLVGWLLSALSKEKGSNAHQFVCMMSLMRMLLMRTSEMV